MMYLSYLNYKEIFIQISRATSKLEGGKTFRSLSFSPVDIEAIAIYQNIVATASHVVKFWKIVNENSNKEKLDYYKLLQLQSRAQNFKFNEYFLVASTYFLTIDLYSLESDEFICQYMGHTCTITSFDFNNHLNLIVSGSADNTVKFWPIRSQEQSIQKIIHKAIRTEFDLIWPIKITIIKYNQDNEYLTIVLCSNSVCFVNLIKKIEDFLNKDDPDENCSFNFINKLQISDIFKSYIDVNLTFSENKLDFYDEENFMLSNKSWFDWNYQKGILNMFLITDDNIKQKKKMFIRQYIIKKNEMTQILDIEYYESKYQIRLNTYFSLLYKKFLDESNVRLFEVISFGFNFSILIGENNKLYIANHKSNSFNLIQNEFNLGKQNNKFFRIMSNNYQNQYVFNDISWLNGLEVDKNQEYSESKKLFLTAFYSSKRNELFVIEWNI